jgi:hypothetical protein
VLPAAIICASDQHNTTQLSPPFQAQQFPSQTVLSPPRNQHYQKAGWQFPRIVGGQSVERDKNPSVLLLVVPPPPFFAHIKQEAAASSPLISLLSLCTHILSPNNPNFLPNHLPTHPDAQKGQMNKCELHICIYSPIPSECALL